MLNDIDEKQAVNKHYWKLPTVENKQNLSLLLNGDKQIYVHVTRFSLRVGNSFRSKLAED